MIFFFAHYLLATPLRGTDIRGHNTDDQTRTHWDIPGIPVGQHASDPASLSSIIFERNCFKIKKIKK